MKIKGLSRKATWSPRDFTSRRKDLIVITIKRRPWIKKLLWGFSVALLLAGLYGFYYVYFKNNDLPDLNKLSKLKLNRVSLVYASEDEIFGRFFYEIRDLVKLKNVPSIVKNAVIAAEDKRFFSHFGVDLVAIFRAWLHNWLSRRIVSGASTVTQQLSRLINEDEVPEFRRRDMTIWRKIKEARIAVQLERKYTKEEILETYFNYIYLGYGRYGIVEAARFYFSKELNELSPSEAAMLAALIKFPSKFSPIEKPQAALERRNLVLLLMKENKFLSESEYQRYRQEPIKLNINKTDSDFGYAMDFVRRQLLESGYGVDDIWYQGGLKIKTTINGRIQKIASRFLREHLVKLNQASAGEEQHKIEGAVIIIENFTGRIAAVVGGHDFLETKYNRAVQKSAIRQPGSAFKIFTYIAALENGIGFEDKICDCPIRLPGKINFYGRVLEWWQPKNFHEKSHPDFMGPISLWRGIVLSRNVATINLARRVGMNNVLQTTKKMGIESELSPYLPTAIGASSVGLLELTAAYSVIASDGFYKKPFIVSQVGDSSGEILYEEPDAKPARVLDESVVEDMTVLLRAVTEVGTAKITFRGIKQKVAGKTGTTNDSRDVLFFGFTPGRHGYTVGVRLGYDMPQSLGEKQTGGLLAAPLCRKIIEEAYKDRPPEPFSEKIEEKLQKLISPK